MNRDPVASTNLASIGYDAASQTLEVRFWNTSDVQQSGRLVLAADAFGAGLGAGRRKVVTLPLS